MVAVVAVAAAVAATADGVAAADGRSSANSAAAGVAMKAECLRICCEVVPSCPGNGR